MPSRERFVYRGKDRTVESISRRAKQSSGQYDSYIDPTIQMFTPKEGDNQVRILPATWKDVEKWGDGWEIPVHLHHNVGPDNATYLCLNKMKGVECPVCSARRDAADQDEADKLRVNWRALCWVIDRANEKAGPLVWSVPITLFQEINARSQDKKSGKAILIDDPDAGYDLIFEREGTQKRTKYRSVEIDRDATPIHDDERLQERWLDFIQDNPLPELLNYYDAEYIEKVLFGRAERRSADGDPVQTRTSRRGHGAAEVEEEDNRRGSRHRGTDRAERVEDETEDQSSRGRNERSRSEPEAEAEAEDRPLRGRRDKDSETPPARRGRVALEDDDETATGRTSNRKPATDEVEERPARRRISSPLPDGGDKEEAERSPSRRMRDDKDAGDKPADDGPARGARDQIESLRRRRG